MVIAVILLILVSIGGATLFIIQKRFETKYSNKTQRSLDVYHEVRRVIDLIDIATKDDILNGRPWQWRYDAFDATFSSLSYNKMVDDPEKDIGLFFAGNPATVPGPRNVVDVQSRVTPKALTQGH